MLPLLLGAGRTLAAGAARGAASQGIKSGISQSAKDLAKDKVQDVAKEKAKSFIENKKDENKGGGLVKKSDGGDNGGGIFGSGSGGGGGSSGGALIKSKKIDVSKLSLISNIDDKKEKKSEDNSDELLKELEKIKDNLINIKKISSANLANTLKNNSLLRKEKEKSKRAQKEEKLESAPKKSKKSKSIKGIKGPGFLDMIWNYISNILLGSLVIWLLNNAPKIIKIFEDITKGLQNPLQQLRLGIITLTRLFPRQIRFLASLTRKILGPPARLIGKLLLKASNVLGNLFKKAGIAIINLVKNPIKNLAKKVLGQAGTQAAKNIGKFASQKVAPAAAKLAGKAANAAGRAANVLKRFKFLSKMFKRVPFVGALIGIGIDLAMGERIDRAIAGAAGASLGAAIGGAIGTGVIPIPYVGTWVGAGIGSAVGDWAGKAIYSRMAGLQSAADKEVPVQGRFAGGGGGISAARAAAQARRSGQNVKAKQAESSAQLSSVTKENAQKHIFKDEKHLNVFSEIRDKLNTSSFVGELLQLGADIAIGEKVKKTRTDIAAQQIGSSIGRALSDDEIQIFGFNKKLIGSFSEGLVEWAKGRIIKDLTSISFPSYDKVMEQSSSTDGDGSSTDDGAGGEPNTAGGAVAASDLYKRIGANAEQWDIFRNSIALIESKGDYKVFGGSGKHYDGRYQMGEAAKKDGSKFAGVPFPGHSSDPNAQVRVSYRNNPQLQETIFTGYTLANHNYLMGNPKYKSANIERKLQILGYAHNQGMGGANSWLNTGVVGADGFGTKGTKYTDLIAKNFKAKKSGGNLQLAQGAVAVPSGGGGGSPDSNRPTVAGSPTDGKNRRIFLHWSAGDYNTPYPAYHSIVLGSGKKVQNTPYDRDKNSHTKGANTNSVGLAVAAAGGSSNDGSILRTPPTSKQLDVMTSEAANLAKSWGWTAASVDSKVKTHGEWERYAVPAGILPPPVQRWDLDKLSQSDKMGSGGPKLRSMIKSKMSAMGVGGGKGNGGPVKKHKASEFILGGGRTLTSDMGMRNFALSPGMHMGIDVSGKTGEPLQAFSDGVVEGTGYEADGYGNWVSWIDDKGIGHFYAHMNKPAFVRKGQKIKKGTILGELGSTGRSSGPHLHWEAATKPGDTGQSKSAVLSRFNPLSKYGIDAPFGGTIRPDPSMASSPSARSPGTSSSPGAPQESVDYSFLDPNFTIAGADVDEKYLQSLKSGAYTNQSSAQFNQSAKVESQINSIKDTPSYAETGSNNIIVMPINSQSQNTPPSGRVNRAGGIAGNLGSGDTDIFNNSLSKVISYSFYKI